MKVVNINNVTVYLYLHSFLITNDDTIMNNEIDISYFVVMNGPYSD